MCVFNVCCLPLCCLFTSSPHHVSAGCTFNIHGLVLVRANRISLYIPFHQLEIITPIQDFTSKGNCLVREFDDFPRWVSRAAHFSLGPPDARAPWYVNHEKLRNTVFCNRRWVSCVVGCDRRCVPGVVSWCCHVLLRCLLAACAVVLWASQLLPLSQDLCSATCALFWAPVEPEPNANPGQHCYRRSPPAYGFLALLTLQEALPQDKGLEHVQSRVHSSGGAVRPLAPTPVSRPCHSSAGT